MKTNRLKLQIIFYVFLAVPGIGQDIEGILQAIDKNNPYLIAERNYSITKNLEYKTGLTPANPSISYGYFPGNKAAPGTKETLDIKQSFDFPTVYVHKNRKAVNQMDQMAFLQGSIRQDLLLVAKTTLLNFIYLTKMDHELFFRKSMAEKMFAGFEKKMEEGTGTVVELNKARMELIKIKNALKVNETSKIRVIEKITQMNGGIMVDLDQMVYATREIIRLDSLIALSLSGTGRIKALGSAKAAAQSEVKIRKAQSLPGFELGYGSEKVASEAFRGARVGMTIPLWEDKNKVKMAQAQVDYTSSLEESVIAEFTSEIRQDYILVETLKVNLEEYKTALDNLNDFEILRKSLDSGHISGIEYFLEVAYYYQIVDLYLDIELEYQLVLARLYKYEL
ncbi:MAG: TolC family protein [Bacteroidetes bacterium]|nr:TolC family protein [Bacteroidota bacterium]